MTLVTETFVKRREKCTVCSKNRSWTHMLNPGFINTSIKILCTGLACFIHYFLKIYLFKANIICIFSETSSAHVQTIFSDQTISIFAYTAEKKNTLNRFHLNTILKLSSLSDTSAADNLYCGKKRNCFKGTVSFFAKVFSSI